MTDKIQKMESFLFQEMTGMKVFLETAIAMVDEWIGQDPCDPPHTYLPQLRDDLRITLKNYEARYLDDSGKDIRFEEEIE